MALLDRVQAPEFSGELPAEFPDDFEQDFEQDLESAAFGAEPSGKRLADKIKGGGATVSPAMKRRIAAEIQIWLELANGLCELKCEPCAAFNEKHIKPLANRLTSIMARYPDLAAKFVESGMIGDWIALFATARPMVKQMVGHHVTHSIVMEGDASDESAEYDQYGPYQR